MSLSFDIVSFEREHLAQLLKNSVDSLRMARQMNADMTERDNELFNAAIVAVNQLTQHLTETKELPHYVDTWGQPRRWEHSSK